MKIIGNGTIYLVLILISFQLSIVGCSNSRNNNIVEVEETVERPEKEILEEQAVDSNENVEGKINLSEEENLFHDLVSRANYKYDKMFYQEAKVLYLKAAEIDANDAHVSERLADIKKREQVYWNRMKEAEIVKKNTKDSIKKNTEVEEQLNTEVEEQINYLTDARDGQTYKTIGIGNQVWMAENLNDATSSGSWCYNNNSKYCEQYGRLYNWETAKSVCPAGWHLPSDKDWMILEKETGMNIGDINKDRDQKTDIGIKLQIGGSSGFNANFGGTRTSDGIFHSAVNVGSYWSSTSVIDDRVWVRFFFFKEGHVGRSQDFKDGARSVRCIQD
jgi:uncharacterized protein (TIGR02145 family)